MRVQDVQNQEELVRVDELQQLLERLAREVHLVLAQPVAPQPEQVLRDVGPALAPRRRQLRCRGDLGEQRERALQPAVRLLVLGAVGGEELPRPRVEPALDQDQEDVRAHRPQHRRQLGAHGVERLVRPALQRGVLLLIPAALVALLAQGAHEAVRRPRQSLLDRQLHHLRRQRGAPLVQRLVPNGIDLLCRLLGLHALLIAQEVDERAVQVHARELRDLRLRDVGVLLLHPAPDVLLPLPQLLRAHRARCGGSRRRSRGHSEAAAASERPRRAWRRRLHRTRRGRMDRRRPHSPLQLGGSRSSVAAGSTKELREIRLLPRQSPPEHPPHESPPRFALRPHNASPIVVRDAQ